MSSLFHDLAFFKNYDGVCVFHRGKPVGDEEDGSAFTELFERVLNAVLGDIIQGRCCFIENQYGRVFRNKRAIAIRCFCPPESLMPRSPT